MIAQHSSSTNEHPTPVDIIDRARLLLSDFDLDPASTEEFNERVQAGAIFDQRDDGLSKPWFGSVFLNPPGGRISEAESRWLAQSGAKTDSTSAAWWDKLITEYAAGRVAQAFFVGFTLEILRNSQASKIPVQAFPRCYPRKRLAFKGPQPTHANVLVYLPSKDEPLAVERLRRAFGDVGLCEGGRT